MKTRSGKPVHLIGYEELLSVPTIAGASDIPLEQLHEFKNHPFHVVEDEAMMELVESIKTNGILSPAIARRRPEGGFELISGHRRKHAAKLAGLEKMPVFVKELTDDEAVIVMVDANIQREEILPSERAFAFKMKMEAMSHQGQRSDLTSSQVATKLDSASSIGKSQGESRDQVFRYIRLTYLIPEILQMVDEKKIALTPAVELSYLTESEQRDLLETMESEDCTPSLSQSQQLKKLSQSGVLDMDRILELLQQPKANQEEKLRFDMKDIRRYFPKNYTTERIQKTILQLLEKFERNWKRRSLDER